jgi:pimeloyl-ACP methyl ester carboxylesterase
MQGRLFLGTKLAHRLTQCLLMLSLLMGLAGQALTASFEVTLMSGVGHFVMQEDPAQFNAIMAELLDH